MYIGNPEKEICHIWNEMLGLSVILFLVKFINVDEVIFEKLFHLKGVLLANSCLNSMFQWEFKSDTALWLSARHASWLPDLYDLCDLYVWYLFVTYQYKRHNWVICIYVQRLSSV